MSAATPLVLVNFVLGLALLGSNLLAFSFNRRRKHYLFYAAASGLALASGTVELLLPSPLSGMAAYMAVYLLFNTTLAVLCLGMAEQFSYKGLRKAVWATWACAFPIVVFTWQTDERSVAAAFLYHLPYAVLAFLTAATIWRSPASRRTTQTSLMVLFAVWGAYFLSRPIQAMVTGELGSADYLGTTYALSNEFIMAVLLIAIAMNLAALAVQETIAELRDQACHDALTGLLNRRGLELALSRLAAGRSEAGAYVAVCDLDRFKAINDDYGHPAGDAVIRHFAATLSGALNADDICARIGGEEFCVVLVGRHLASALEVLDGVRTRFAELSIPELPQDRHVTASFGVTRLSSPASLHQAYEQADVALLSAKRDGRNRVAHHGGNDQPSRGAIALPHAA